MDQARGIAGAFDASTARYELRCWGPFQLHDRATGEDIAPPGRKARAMLVYLARQSEAGVTRDRLATLLWGDRGQEQARSSLRQALHELRGLSAAPPLVEADRERVFANPNAIDTELERFERLAFDDELEALTAAVSRSAGALFADLDGVTAEFDDWLRAERVRQEEQRIELAATAAESAIDRGDPGQALALIRALESIDPASERIARAGMRADLASGDRGGARRRYQRLREALARELGVEPGEETERLHRQARSRGGSGAANLEESIVAESDVPASAAPSAVPRRRWRWVAAVALLALLAIGAVAWRMNLSGAGAEPPAIAVLPFRDLAPGEDYFAEGVAEEILAQLAGEPGLQVAGRTSSWLFGDGSADVREIGRRLDVDYVLEGSVRRAGDRVRVDVTLVDTANGMRLWSHPFEGRLDDIFAIQRAIGRGIRERLRLQLVQRAPASEARTTSGEVYTTYLIARGMMRTRDDGSIRTAEELLRRALRADPSFAPARSRLGVALWISAWSDVPGRRDEALRQVRRALELDPDLAEAHAALGMMLAERGEGLPHLERAVRLDPEDTEAWYWLSAARRYAHDFDGALDAIRHVATIDPFWVRSAVYADAAWEMGHREEAMRFERRIIADHPLPAHREMARARVAARRGDWSGYILHNRRAARRDIGNDVSRQADVNARLAMLRLGFPFEAPVDTPMTRLWARVGRGDVPPLDRVPGVIEAPWDFWELADFNVTVSRVLIREGRGVELVALYDGAFGSPEAMSRFHDLVHHAPTVAIALSGVGRRDEARRLLALADRQIRAVMGRGRMPVEEYVMAARVWATMGRRQQAIALLERAVAAGWPWADGAGDTDPWVPRIVLAEDPGFRNVRNDPRLRRIDAMIEANRARERREVEAMLAAG